MTSRTSEQSLTVSYTHLWGLIERRLAAIDEMVDDYSIDGVIQFAQWGCRQSNGGASTLADHLKKLSLIHI